LFSFVTCPATHLSPWLPIIISSYVSAVFNYHCLCLVLKLFPALVRSQFCYSCLLAICLPLGIVLLTLLLFGSFFSCLRLFACIDRGKDIAVKFLLPSSLSKELPSNKIQEKYHSNIKFTSRCAMVLMKK